MLAAAAVVGREKHCLATAGMNYIAAAGHQHSAMWSPSGAVAWRRRSLHALPPNWCSLRLRPATRSAAAAPRLERQDACFDSELAAAAAVAAAAVPPPPHGHILAWNHPPFQGGAACPLDVCLCRATLTPGGFRLQGGAPPVVCVPKCALGGREGLSRSYCLWKLWVISLCLARGLQASGFMR